MCFQNGVTEFQRRVRRVGAGRAGVGITRTMGKRGSSDCDLPIEPLTF